MPIVHSPFLVAKTMHDKGQQTSAGAIAVIAVIAVILVFVLLLVGGLVVVGLGFSLVQRGTAVEQKEVARVKAEMTRAMVVDEQALVEADLVEAQLAVEDATRAEGRFTIQLDQVGDITVDGHKLDSGALTERLKDAIDEGGDLKVIIEADEDCPLQNVAAITDACLEVGIRDVRITVSEEGSVVIE